MQSMYLSFAISFAVLFVLLLYHVYCLIDLELYKFKVITNGGDVHQPNIDIYRWFVKKKSKGALSIGVKVVKCKMILWVVRLLAFLCLIGTIATGLVTIGMMSLGMNLSTTASNIQVLHLSDENWVDDKDENTADSEDGSTGTAGSTGTSGNTDPGTGNNGVNSLEGLPDENGEPIEGELDNTNGLPSNMTGNNTTSGNTDDSYLGTFIVDGLDCYVELYNIQGYLQLIDKEDGAYQILDIAISDGKLWVYDEITNGGYTVADYTPEEGAKVYYRTVQDSLGNNIQIKFDGGVTGSRQYYKGSDTGDTIMPTEQDGVYAYSADNGEATFDPFYGPCGFSE